MSSLLCIVAFAHDANLVIRCACSFNFSKSSNFMTTRRAYWNSNIAWTKRNIVKILSLSLCPSLYLCLFLSVSLILPLSLSPFFSFLITIFLSINLSIYLPFFPYISIFLLALCLFLCHSVCLRLFLCLCRSLYFSPLSLLLYLHIYLFIFLSIYLYIYIYIYIFISLSRIVFVSAFVSQPLPLSIVPLCISPYIIFPFHNFFNE